MSKIFRFFSDTNLQVFVYFLDGMGTEYEVNHMDSTIEVFDSDTVIEDEASVLGAVLA